MRLNNWSGRQVKKFVFKKVKYSAFGDRDDNFHVMQQQSKHFYSLIWT